MTKPYDFKEELSDALTLANWVKSTTNYCTETIFSADPNKRKEIGQIITLLRSSATYLKNRMIILDSKLREEILETQNVRFDI